MDIITICKEEQVYKYIQNISIDIVRKYSNKLHFICILEGARVFMDALILELRKQNIFPIVSYIKTKSTQDMKLCENIQILHSDIKEKSCFDIDMKHIIIDDLIDSGHTIEFVKQYLLDKGFDDIKSVVLFNKYKNSNISDICGYDLELDKNKMKENGIFDYWLFGCGMDLDDDFRYIKKLKAKVIYR
jgi:hypoxanthine phosphoribosyltransferase